jgi:hypothetical protein
MTEIAFLINEKVEFFINHGEIGGKE